MEKLFAGLTIIIITLSFSCGLLLYITNDMQNQNNESKEQISEYQNQINQLEKQIEELENQIEDLEEQVCQKKLSDARQVKITKIEVGNQISSSPLWGTVVEVHVTVHNFGINNIDGLTLKTSATSESVYDKAQVGLYAGETKTFTVEGYEDEGIVVTNLAIIMFNDIILDKKQF